MKQITMGKLITMDFLNFGFYHYPTLTRMAKQKFLSYKVVHCFAELQLKNIFYKLVKSWWKSSLMLMTNIKSINRTSITVFLTYAFVVASGFFHEFNVYVLRSYTIFFSRDSAIFIYTYIYRWFCQSLTISNSRLYFKLYSI